MKPKETKKKEKTRIKEVNEIKNSLQTKKQREKNPLQPKKETKKA